MPRSLLLALFLLAIPLVAQPSGRAPDAQLAYVPLATVREGRVKMPTALARRVTVRLANVPLQRALMEIANQAQLGLSYSDSVVRSRTMVSLDVGDLSAADALAAVTLGTPWSVLVTAGGQVTVVPADRDLTATIEGSVTDAATRQPVAGASVTAGAGRGAATGVDGRYRIAGIPAGPVTLSVRRLGYAPQSRALVATDGATFTEDFALTALPNRLQQVVTTVTGEQRRAELGNNIASIRADSVAANAPITSLTDLLAGRASNVQVLYGSGVSGAGARVRIRGLGSTLLSNDPIVIIDGIRVEAGAPNYTGLGAVAGTLGGQRPSRLNDINPEEIESIEVIKGPSAATLYGTNAANGVISIRTRRGARGAAQWSVYGEYGAITQPAEFPDAWYQFGRTRTGAATQCFLWTVASGDCTADSTSRYSPLNDEARTPFGTGNRQQVGAQVSGGSEAVRYFVSGEYEGERGPIEMPASERTRISLARGGAAISDQQRYPNALWRASARANVNAVLSPAADLASSVGFTRSRTRLPFDGTFTNGLMLNALQGRGYRDANEGYLFFRPGELFAQEYFQDIARFTGSTTGTWRPQAWLTVRAIGGLDYTGRVNDLLQRRGQGPTSVPDGQRALQRGSIYRYTGDASATAAFTLGGGWTSRTSLGTQYYRDQQYVTDVSGVGLGPSAQTVNGSTTPSQSEGTVETTTFGGYVDQTFGFGERLFLTAALRADGNSAFGDDFRTAYYPKTSLSWLIDREGWFPEIRGVSSVRLRAAYGASGVQPGALAALRYYNLFTATVNGVNTSAVELAAVGNSGLKPERTTEFEGGADVELGGGRLTLELTYYDKRSRDALVNRAIAASLGGGSRLENLGKVRNAGWEYNATANVVSRAALAWDVTVSGSTNRNEILALDPTVRPTGVIRDQVGYPIASLWTRPILRYADANNNGAIDPAEVILGDTATYAGPSNPTRELSLTNGITLPRLNLRISAMLDYRGGYRKLNATELNRCFANACRPLTDPAAPELERARAAIARTFSFAGFAEDASFVRLREVGVTWTAPARVARWFRSRTAAVVLTGRNLGLWTDYTGIDPEVSTRLDDSDRTRDYPTVPAVRYWIARVSLGF